MKNSFMYFNTLATGEVAPVKNCSCSLDNNPWPPAS